MRSGDRVNEYIVREGYTIKPQMPTSQWKQDYNFSALHVVVNFKYLILYKLNNFFFCIFHF